MLSLKKLKLIYDKKNNFYYIDKVKIYKKKLPEKHLYTIKLDTLIFDNIKFMLDLYKDIKYSYISNTNTIVLFSTKKIYDEIKNVISKNDNKREQFQLKITVIETNLDDTKEKGVQIKSYLQKNDSSNINYFVNLITMPQTATNNIFKSSLGFSASLKFLNTLGVSSLKSSPTMTVQSGKKIYFSSVQNIPYLSSKSSVNGASQSSSQQVTYKDVGLKIDMVPTLINNVVFIDLNFTIESILDKTSLTPTIAKREIKNSFQLKKGQLLVLSGLVQEEKTKSTIGIPILMKMPYIGQMFRYDIDNKTKKSLSVLIEII